MAAGVPPLPDDIEALKAALATVSAELAVANAKAADDQALIAHLKLMIAKLRREQFGSSAERSRRLLDQMELQLEELEASASEDELAAEAAAAKTPVAAFTRKRPSRQPFPEHLPRERVVMPAPCSCPACGSTRLSKLGEDITETLEVIPRQWKVLQTVREKVSCRDCEAVTQPPAPFHVVPRGWAGPSFLAMLLFEKFGQHQPLNRQADRFAREGVPLSLSTLADQVGAACAALMPLHRRLEAHVLAAERLHGDDTTVPVLAKGKTDTARLWVYVRDDRPFGGPTPPAALFHYSRDRRGEHPRAHLVSWSGILQADAYGGYGELYAPDRQPGPVLEAGCFAHARRKFFELADVAAAARRKSRGQRDGRSIRSRSRPFSASTPCSTSSARPAAKAPPSGLPLAANTARHVSRISTSGWRRSFASSRATTILPRRSPTCCAGGTRSPDSSTTAGSASPTMPQNGRCAASRSAANPGCSAAPIAAASAPPSCTA